MGLRFLKRWWLRFVLFSACILCSVVYAYTMNKPGKGINPGPPQPAMKINSKPTGGGRVGPSTVYPTNPHPKANTKGRTGTVGSAMKGMS